MKPNLTQSALETRVQSQDRTRNELIAATHRVYLREGFDGTTVSKIAREAGYTTGAVYSNFSGKLDLLFALMEREAEIFALGRLKVAVDLPDFDTMFAALSSQWQATIEDNIEIYRLLYRLQALSLGDAEAGRRFEQLDQGIRDRLANLIEEVLVELGFELTVPVARLASAVQALSNGYSMRQTNRIDPGLSLVFSEDVRVLFRSMTRPENPAER